jgi:hypothetical protein
MDNDLKIGLKVRTVFHCMWCHGQAGSRYYPGSNVFIASAPDERGKLLMRLDGQETT